MPVWWKGREKKKLGRVGAAHYCEHVVVHLCAIITMVEEMLRFVKIVKVPQIACAHHHYLLHKRKPYLEYTWLAPSGGVHEFTVCI